MKRLKRILGVGLVAGLALSAVGVIGSSPAGATIRTGFINCSSSTILGPIAIRNPSTSHVTGPVWAAPSAAITITTKAGLTLLPRTVGVATIGSYQDLVNKSQIVGINNAPTATAGPEDTALTIGPIPGLVFTYDPDLADNGGVPNPVAMNGVATYLHALDGVLGPFPAPTVVVSGPLPFVGIPGTYDVTTTLDPGVGTLPTGSTPGNPGAGLFVPDVPVAITNVGTGVGVIDVVATSTAVTANVTAPLVTAAVTTCGPSADPTFRANVTSNGGLRVDASPVIACKPTLGTAGLGKDSKGWWSQDTDIGTAENYGGSLSVTTTYDGCDAPDTKLNDWVISKNGALPADSNLLAKAAITVKAKHYGNCTQVDLLSAAGLSHGANSPTAYEASGTVAAKWQTAALVTSKVKASTAYSAVRLVVDTTGLAPKARFEANGIVTKGAGLGGALEFLAELDGASAQVAGIIACNSPGYVAPAVGIMRGNVAPYLPVVTGDDAVISIETP